MAGYLETYQDTAPADNTDTADSGKKDNFFKAENLPYIVGGISALIILIIVYKKYGKK